MNLLQKKNLIIKVVNNMNKAYITIEYPDKFTKEEVLKSIIQEIDTKSLATIGIKVYLVENN